MLLAACLKTRLAGGSRRAVVISGAVSVFLFATVVSVHASQLHSFSY